MFDVIRAIGLGILLSALVALGGMPSWSAENLQLRRCTKVTTITHTTGPVALSDLSDVPSIICSVDFTSNGVNGFVQIFDSPTDSTSHGQAVTVAEIGAAASNNSASAYYGELGRLTQFGLEVQVLRGTAVVSWDD